ncbi:nucleotidyl transferase AbiEii/AbiGii toxin family protein [Nocardioides zeae]|uniref:Nucleotidyl transferase AbiEii/AbiGii toxin family protein n=1 Tax=Nocardioides zeae TaxID=1457234 RepID=A0A6P0HNZ9_9ACTN|nr:nucleotidyl transferase AbiEii/AbiGii toxin family protein [Nocardioides zeae]NEN80422.1 nucleotidyl transferase AbiEii/AbiGii toxin family protein [Nocardioides zeae]
MTEPAGQHRGQYDAEVADLVLSHAADVLRANGFASHHIVVIGGLVPSLLVPVLDAGVEPHVGTADVDLCLSVALVEGDTGTYQRIEAVLKELQFAQGDDTFRWVRRHGFPMTVEFFCPAGPGRPAGRAWRPKAAENPIGKQNMGGRLSALSLEAGALLTSDVEVVERDIELPGGKGRVRFSFRVTGPVAFLVAKVQALHERDKPKDAYDIVWLIESWPGGPAAAAAAFAARPAFGATEVAPQIELLRRAFADRDSVGARSYARFLASAPGDEALLELRAVGAVAEFLAELPPTSEG